jgi:hypothetical protein
VLKDLKKLIQLNFEFKNPEKKNRNLDLGLDFGFHGFLDVFWAWIFLDFGFAHPNPIQKPDFF